jgi:rod shape-determining protein MreD
VAAALGLLIPALCAVLQVTVVRFLALGEARPDVLAVAVVGWSIFAGPAPGMAWAFVGGLTADLLGSAAFGATAVSLLPVGFGFGLRDRTTGEPTLLAAALLVGAGALAHQLLHAVVLALVGSSLPPLGLLLAGALGTAVYTAVVGAAAYPLLRMVHRRTVREPAFDW